MKRYVAQPQRSAATKTSAVFCSASVAYTRLPTVPSESATSKPESPKCARQKASSTSSTGHYFVGDKLNVDIWAAGRCPIGA